MKYGKILWQQPVDHLDAWPADKAKVAKETRAKHLRYWRQAMTWWNRLFWDNAANTFSSRPAAEFDELAAQAKQAGYDWGQGERETIDGKEVVQARRGVSGGVRSRYYWRVGTKEMQQTYEACAKNCYHWYSGWTSEGSKAAPCTSCARRSALRNKLQNQQISKSANEQMSESANRQISK